jgi:PAS domain S-box-containing protein
VDLAINVTNRGQATSLLRRIRSVLPTGQTLSSEEWHRRHRILVTVVWLQVPGFVAYSTLQGYSAAHTFAHVSIIAAFALAAMMPGASQRVRAASVSVGLMTGAAIAVHSSHGAIEAHFYFFVAVIALTLYEDWIPFLLAIVYVVLHHGILGTIDTGSVYDHGGNPWYWAGIHGAFVLTAGAFALVAWRLNEDVRVVALQSERERLRAEARYERIVELASKGICTTDAEGKITFTNPRMAEMLGYEPQELIGGSLEKFVLEEDRHLNLNLQSRNGSEQRLEQEIRFLRRDGEVLWTLLSTTELSEDDDGPDRWLTVVGDITQVHEAQSEADRLKGEFFALVSHELRTPLTSIIGYLDMLEETQEARLDQKGRKYTDVMKRNSVRLNGLIEDLLLLAQVDAGTFNVSPQLIDVEEIAQRAVESAKPQAAKLQVTLSYSGSSLGTCMGDAERLGGVFDNLLSNALKFTPAGGRVDVRVSEQDGQAVIEVGDTGIGIPEDEQGQLFERFFRAERAKMDQIRGVGLGLPIAREIVRAHGGDITLESTEGEGTELEVRLPLQSSFRPPTGGNGKTHGSRRKTARPTERAARKTTAGRG